MAGLKITISNKELIKVLDRHLDIVADEIFANSQENIIKKKIVDEGTLLGSGTINRKPFEKEIIYFVPYADNIEFGRVEGSMPPFDPIFNWVQRKLGEKDDAKAKRITNKIRWDIYQNGQDPRPFLQPAIDQYLAKVKR